MGSRLFFSLTTRGGDHFGGAGIRSLSTLRGPVKYLGNSGAGGFPLDEVEQEGVERLAPSCRSCLQPAPGFVGYVSDLQQRAHYAYYLDIYPSCITTMAKIRSTSSFSPRPNADRMIPAPSTDVRVRAALWAIRLQGAWREATRSFTVRPGRLVSAGWKASGRHRSIDGGDTCRRLHLHGSNSARSVATD